jgi:hypothetical protein
MVLHARCRHLEPASSRLKGGDDDVVRWVISSNGVHCGATTSSLPRAISGVPVAATVEARVWSANRSVVASRLRDVASNARSTRLKARVPGAEARPGDACLEGAAGCAAMPLADCALLAQKSQPLPGPGCCTNKDVFRSCPNLGAGRGARIGFEAVSIDRATPRPKNDTAVPAASSWCPDHFLPTLTRPGRPADVPAVPVPSTQPGWARERFAGIDQDLEKG